MTVSTRKRLANVAIACAAMAGSAASCIDDETGYIFVELSAAEATFVETEDGLRIRLELETFVDSDGQVLLDSALFVVNHDGQSTSLPDPDIDATGFPVDGYGQPSIALEVPSPISDVTSFDAFCDANGRSVDVTLRFYSTSIDPEPSEPPPLTEIATSAPLTLAGAPDAPNVIGASGVSALGTNAGSVVKNVVSGPEGNIFFVVGAAASPATLTAYRADQETQEEIPVLGFQPFPRLASDDSDVLYIAGVDELGPLRFSRLSGADASEFSIARDASSPEYESFSVVASQPTATGLRAAIISSFPLVHPIITPAEGTPPADKYYGAFVVEAAYVDGSFEPTALLQVDREIVSWLPLADGMLQISSELPPRSNDTTLRIERLDTAGVVVWSHDEPVNGRDVDSDILSDGTVLVAYELATGFVEALRLAADDGGELARASFSGTHPTIAGYGSDSALLSFTGRAPQDGVAGPARPVPLLLELDASMTVSRVAQIACSGSADLQRAGDGSLLLVGAFAERFTLGENVTEIDTDALILTKIAEPL